MTLLAHSNTKRTTMEIVKAVPRPEFTKTWKPYSHADVLNSLESNLKREGLRAVGHDFSLSKNGAKMFGVIKLDAGISTPNGALGFAIGVRNGIDKSLSYGLCGGINPFVCDNLMFSGDFVEFRRHNATLDEEELERFTVRAISLVTSRIKVLSAWHSGLAAFECPEEDAKVLTYDCMTKGVFSPSKFNEFRDCVKIEDAVNPDDHRGTLYNFHGGVTRMMKGASLFHASQSTAALKGVIDEYLTAEPKAA